LASRGGIEPKSGNFEQKIVHEWQRYEFFEVSDASAVPIKNKSTPVKKHALNPYY
jgi:hypothetical protein